MASRTAIIAALPVLGQFARSAPPRSAPAVLRTVARKARRVDREDAFKDAVWDRDKVSRASGKPVFRNHIDPEKRGEVAHIKARSTNPTKKYDPNNGVLLTAVEHGWSDPRTANAKGKVLLEIKGTNARKALTFIRRDVRGREIWRYTSTPPGARR